MAVQGLDRAGAPSPSQARQMLDDIGGSFWNVYVGGPESSGSGWTPDMVKAYTDAGINRFMLTYVGRQSHGPLNGPQGEVDGHEACNIVASFGYGQGTPICLDLEGGTFNAAPAAALQYAGGWCRAVRVRGFRPGVYSNPFALIPMASLHDVPDFVWVADWIGHSPQAHDPHHIPGLPDGLWLGHGQRAWQYAGGPAVVGGLAVDINVADEGCLAGAPGGSAFPGEILLAGSTGPNVAHFQARLIALGFDLGPSGADGDFGMFTTTATKKFQAERHLVPNGVVGPETWRAAFS